MVSHGTGRAGLFEPLLPNSAGHSGVTDVSEVLRVAVLRAVDVVVVCVAGGARAAIAVFSILGDLGWRSERRGENTHIVFRFKGGVRAEFVPHPS